MTADAVEQRLFLGVGPGKACQPFGIGELLCQIPGRPQLDIGGGGVAGGDIRRLRTVEVVADSANGERIAAGLELGRGEAKLAGVVADHGDGQGRTVALGAHDDAFHGALRGGADLTGQRGWRLSVRGKDREPGRNHAGGQSKQKISRWHRRLLVVSTLNANGKRKRCAHNPRRAHLQLQAVWRAEEDSIHFVGDRLVETHGDGQVNEINVRTGDFAWLPGAASRSLTNVGSSPLELVEIELK
jgi:mannose-6-phosphate isomerase-like protein (cupin superfamily)